MIDRIILKTTWLLILPAVLMTVVLLQQTACCKAIVDLKPEVVVNCKEISLGDIATIQGASGPQKELLSSVPLGKAPLPAREYELRSSYVVAKMKQSLIDMNAVDVRGPENIVVRADGNVLKGEALVQKARDYIYAHTDWPKDQLRFEVPRTPADLSLPPGKLDVDVWRVSGDFYGLTFFRSDIRVDGRSTASVPFVVDISRTVPVVVASCDMQRGTTLKKEDFRIEKRNLGEESKRVRMRYCKPKDDIVGKRVKTHIAAGRVMTYDMLLDPPMVERREQVTIQTQHGGILVSTKGVALRSAAVGEDVPVRNNLSGKTIVARVVGPGTVVVE